MITLKKVFYKANQIVITEHDAFLYLMEYIDTRDDLAKECWVVYNSITKHITMTWLKVPHASKNI